MNRRNYLAILGSAALAGCAGTGGDPTDTGTAPGAGSPSPSPTGTETVTTEKKSFSRKAGAKATGAIDVAGVARLGDVEWKPEAETPVGTGAVVGTVTNVSGDRLGRYHGRLTLLTEAGDMAGTGGHTLRFMKKGSTAEFVLPYSGDSPGAVASFRYDAQVWSKSLTPVNDGQFAVDAGEYGRLGDGGYGVTGTVTNETDRTIFRVLPHVNFYDGKTLLASADDAITNLEAGSSAEFVATFPGASPKSVGEAQVVVTYEN